MLNILGFTGHLLSHIVLFQQPFTNIKIFLGLEAKPKQPMNWIWLMSYIWPKMLLKYITINTIVIFEPRFE